MEQLEVQIVNSLRNGESEEECALVQAGYLIKEKRDDEAYDIIRGYCQTIREKFYKIERQRICPVELRREFEALCFAATRCSDIPELKRLKKTFEKYFGREFVTSSKKLESLREEILLEKLSLEPPSLEDKLEKLSAIASTNNITWRYSRRL
ncbi:PREDICTED: uncharacterized protein LOC101312024 [Fragaria vesca subsp. vesca]|uniref:uncharacterized protein LOC101312024 n=1 Tax=Fragaria vesca subsp. vesca TaxID=101020 RepID=UPI0002C2F957|nr:PREDICTED: uncharacterized protein LOC101312024 [Fragaria vesca subsp. vesca]